MMGPGLLFSASTVVETPARYRIQVKDRKHGKTGSKIAITGDQVSELPHMSPRWHYWSPRSTQDTFESVGKRYWTRQYIGTDPQFYDAGFRWGVSLGGDATEFKRSALYVPGGGINLPNGKYMIAIRQDREGRKEVVLGKEDRGCDSKVLDAYHQGILPQTNQYNEILGVSNHSMLISRGKPYLPGISDPDEFAATFAGEVEIINHRIETVNDQTGQLFGPNGLSQPPDRARFPDDQVMKQPDYESGKSLALKDARDTLTALTGQARPRLVQVRFVQDGLSGDQLQGTRKLTLKKTTPDQLAAMLREPFAQSLFDQFRNQPEDQLRLLNALSRHGELRFAVQDLTDGLVGRGTLKPEQGAALALELLMSPEIMGLFLPASACFIAGLSDNTKRKLVTAFNALKQEKGSTPDFKTLTLNLKQHRELVRFLSGQRVPAGLLKSILPALSQADSAAALARSLFATGPATRDSEPFDISGTNPELIGNLQLADAQLNRLRAQAKRKGGDRPTVMLHNNPFNGSLLDLTHLRRNVERLRRLEQAGVTIYGSPAFRANRAYDFLKDLFVYAHQPETGQDAVNRQDMERLLRAYEVNPKQLYAFTRARFQKRWSNQQIIMAYTQQDPHFRRFLQDVHWAATLPLATV